MAPASTPDAGQLTALTRAELNATAAELRIANPEELPNKGAVVAAIVDAQAGPQPRTFRLAAGETHRVCFGASPRVSIGAGETYTTTDPRLAARLAAKPALEEVTP